MAITEWETAMTQSPVTLDGLKPETPQWSPRMWEGCNCRLGALLIRGRFAAVPLLYIAIIVTSSASCTDPACCRADLRARGRTDQHAPIFIIGHQRTGTTLLSC